MIAIAWSALLAGCGVQADEAERPAPLVATVLVGGADATSRQLTGEVKARVDSALGFRIAGQIVERPVRRGEAVRRGQVLARLDGADIRLASDEVRAQATAAERSVAAARASAMRTVADERRLAPLVGTGGIAAQDYENTRSAAEAAAAELAAAEARLAAARAAARRAENQSAYSTLVADADGVVAELLAEPGQVVQVGQPVVRLARAGGRDAVVAVPEAIRASLPRQATATLYGTDRRYAATLREVAGAADPRTRSSEARYALAGADDIPPGTTVTLELASAPKAAAALAVPLGAVVDRGQGAGVWVVTDDGVIKARPVRVASVRDEHAIIEEGLQPGERIVALGAHLLNDGQRVRVGALPR